MRLLHCPGPPCLHLSQSVQWFVLLGLGFEEGMLGLECVELPSGLEFVAPPNGVGFVGLLIGLEFVELLSGTESAGRPLSGIH